MRSTLALCVTTLLLAACSSKPPASAPSDGVHSAVKAGQTATTTETQSTSDETVVASTAVAGQVTCTKGKDERMLSVVKPEVGGCEVSYAKFGTDQRVANSKADLSYCDNVLTKIRGNLEASGFSCK